MTMTTISSPQMDQDHKKARVEILLSCLIPVVGLNNFWRFSLLAYENGGGAFWYAYVIAIWTIGISTHYLNLSLGQFTSACGVSLYSKFGKGFSGIAVTQAYTCICVSTYYCVLCSYILIYIYYFAFAEFPWSACKEEWGSDCAPLGGYENVLNKSFTSSADYFFMHVVLQHSDERVNWKIVICGIVSVIIIVLYLSAQPLRMDKVYSVILIVPFVLMCALTGIAASMRGSLRGIRYFFLPDFSYLTKIDVWFNVISHCLFSLGQGLGVLTMWSSRNYFSMNLKWVSLLVALFQICQTCMVGMITFAVLSNLSSAFDGDLTKIIKSSSDGIPFIVYSVVLSELSETPFIMAMAFFGIMYVIALLSIAILFYLGMTVMSQLLPTVNVTNSTAISFSLVCFCMSILYGTKIGHVCINIFNNICVPILVVVTVFLELVMIMYSYGMYKVCVDLQYMYQQSVYLYLRIMWGILTPLTLFSVLIAYLITFKVTSTVVYEAIISWVVIVIGLLPIPTLMVYHMSKNRREPCIQRVKEAFSSTEYGPEDPDVREAWLIFKEEELQKRNDGNDNFFVGFIKLLFGK